MTARTILSLPVLTAPSGDEWFEVVQNGVSYRMNSRSLASLVASLISQPGKLTLSATQVAEVLSDALDVMAADAQRGDVLFRSVDGWQNLPAGSDAQALTTHGVGFDPTWETVQASGGGGTPTSDQTPFCSVAPVITPGTSQVAVPLTCSTGTWAGSPFPTFTYQWWTADTNTPISGATSNVYTPIAADVGHHLKCVVTATNKLGAVAQSSNWTGVVAAQTTTSAPAIQTAPAISGTVGIGSQLAASTGVWSGSPVPTYAFQWYWADTNTAINGATASTYIPVAADYGHTLKVVVTATNSVSSATATSAATAAVPGVAPTGSNPSVSPSTATVNTAGQGTQLQVTPGTYSGVPTPTLSYQWFYADTNVAISGATGTLYTVQPADVSHTVRCRVRASNAAGSLDTFSNVVPVSQAAPADVAPSASSSPVISGTPQVGQTLTVSNGNWTGTPTPTFAYQWYWADTGGAIPGANATTYSPVSGDVGRPLKARVTATNTAGTASADSAPTAAVTAAAGGSVVAPTLISAPVISGSTTSGGTLSVSQGSWSETPVVLPVNNIAPVVSGTTTQGQTLSIASPTIDAANLSGTADLTFDEQWDSLSLWNGSTGRWTTTSYWDTPGGYSLFSNNEAEWYIDDRNPPPVTCVPWTVSGGVLSLTAAQTASGNLSYANNQPYTSGQLNSYHSFSQLYGYFEARLQFPRGKGLWPAFWLLQNDRGWPPEIDIVEFINDSTSKWYGATHSNADGNQAVVVDNGTDVTAGFHTYAINWTPSKIEWYFDGVKVDEKLGVSDWTLPAFILLNLAVGGSGSWPGAPDGATIFPATYKCDYVRVWQVKPAWSNATTLAYQWKRDGVAIGGATSATYTLQAADVGHNVSVTVTGTNASGSTSVTSASVGPVGASSTAPSNTAAPVVSGTAMRDQTLSCTTGTWSGTSPITYAYQWKRAGSAIPGATSSTYTLILADVGASISCDVTATNSVGSATQGSNSVGPVSDAGSSASLNPSDKSAGITLSNGNLTATCAGGGGVRSTTAKSSGKFYWEVTIGGGVSPGLDGPCVGISNASQDLNAFLSGPNGLGLFPEAGGTGRVYWSPTYNFAGMQWDVGSVLAFALDKDNNRFWIKHRPSGGVFTDWNANASADPASNVGGIDISTLGDAYVALQLWDNGETATVNFGASAYVGAAPTGYTNW